MGVEVGWNRATRWMVPGLARRTRTHRSSPTPHGSFYRLGMLDYRSWSVSSSGKEGRRTYRLLRRWGTGAIQGMMRARTVLGTWKMRTLTISTATRSVTIRPTAPSLYVASFLSASLSTSPGSPPALTIGDVAWKDPSVRSAPYNRRRCWVWERKLLSAAHGRRTTWDIYFRE